MKDGFIPAHGGYEDLLSFQKARIIYDGTAWFCDHLSLEQVFIEEGGLRERVTRARLARRAGGAGVDGVG